MIGAKNHARQRYEVRSARLPREFLENQRIRAAAHVFTHDLKALINIGTPE
jgi:hypothetical protein